MQTIRTRLSVRRVCSCSRRGRKNAMKHRLTPQLLFSVLLVSACATHSRFHLPSYTHTGTRTESCTTRADVYNVIVKAFYISMLGKKIQSLFANSGRASLKSCCKNYRCGVRTRCSLLPRAIRSDWSLNVSAYNGDRKFGSR